MTAGSDFDAWRSIKRLAGSRIWWLVLLLILLLAGCYAYVSCAMASGVTSPDRSPLDGHPEEYGLPYEDVTFSPRGDEWADIVLRGWIIEEEEPTRSGEELTVILVHGLNSNRTGDNAMALASRLFDLDFRVLLFDMRGHGESDGDQLSAGYFERWDVLGAYDFLIERGVPPDSIGVLGWSMGGATALLAVAEESRVRAVITDSAFAHIRDMIAQETARTTVFPEWAVPLFIPGMEVVSDLLYGIDVGAVAPEQAAATLGYPILVIHGDADSRIPVEQSVRIHAAALEGSDLWVIPGSDHADGFLDAPDEYVERVDTYLKDRLIKDAPDNREGEN